jgi:hypothetical protein
MPVRKASLVRMWFSILLAYFKKLVSDGLETPPGRGEPDADKALLKIAGRLLEYEEEVFEDQYGKNAENANKQLENPNQPRNLLEYRLSTLPSQDQVRELASGIRL